MIENSIFNGFRLHECINWFIEHKRTVSRIITFRLLVDDFRFYKM